MRRVTSVAAAQLLGQQHTRLGAAAAVLCLGDQQQLNHHSQILSATLQGLHVSVQALAQPPPSSSNGCRQRQRQRQQPSPSQQPSLPLLCGAQSLWRHLSDSSARSQAYSTWQARPAAAARWQRQQRQSPATPWLNIRDARLAQMAGDAFKPQHSPQQRAACLHAAFDALLQQLQEDGARTLHPTDVSWLLHCFEVAGTAVRWPAMRQLLQHMDAHVHTYDCKAIMRVLRSASYAKLAGAGSSNSGRGSGSGDGPAAAAAAAGAAGAAGLQCPSLRNLLQWVWTLTKGGGEALRPASVPQLLRCVSVLQQGEQQHMISSTLLDGFVDLWLDSCGIGTASDTSSSSSNASSGGGGDGSSSSQWQEAQHAATVIKAVHGMNMQLLGPHLQRLLQPVTALVQQRLGDPSNSSSHAVETAAWIWPLMIATHKLDRSVVLPESVRARALQAASQALKALAAAGESCSNSNCSSSSGSGSAAGAAADTVAVRSPFNGKAGAVASSIVEICQALAALQRGSPLKKVTGLVDSLAYALLATDAHPRQLAAFAASLAGLDLAPSLDCMTDLTAAACAIQPGRRMPEPPPPPPQQQQQQQPWQDQQGDKASQFLWASAAMGYSLGPHELQVLLQQLAALKQPVTSLVAQAMWAIAQMGPIQQHHHQQQGQRWDNSLDPGVAELACQLLSKVLQEQQQARAASSSSSSKAAVPVVLNISAWMGPQREMFSMNGHVAWQLSVVAWSAAVCDLSGCKDTVLALCGILAQPGMWAALRQAELVQLLLVHLWLSGDFVWSDSRGLAAVLRPEQLALLREAKVASSQRLAVSGAAQQQQQHVSSSGSAGSSSAPADSTAAAAGGGLAAGANMVQTSLAQTAVWTSLQQVSGVVSAELEALTADQLFTVDALVETDTGRQIAVEFDGPYHYSIAVPSAATSSQGEQQHHHQQQEQEEEGSAVKGVKGRPAVSRGTLPGTTREPQLVPVRRLLLRNKALAARGLEVLCVPYFEWSQCQNKPARRQYLTRLIKETAV